MELVLTGRYPSRKLIDLADYVSEIKKIKHPYDKGILARKGIEK
jgi:cob(I)alamin adenosyltransferase